MVVVLALLWVALLGAAIIAAIPPLHGRVLRTIRWAKWPVVGKVTGAGATALLFAGSCGAFVGAAVLTPPPTPTPVVPAASSAPLTALASASPMAPPSAAPSTPSSAATATGSAPPAAPASPIGRVRAEVVRVTDGDTIRVRLDGREYAVRYIGIDTPETVDPRRDVECFGREASAFNTQMVGGKIVELEKDVSETDRFGRLLRYVYVDGRMVNEELVRNGYATASSYPPDVKHQERFRALEAEARARGVGLWAEGACAAASASPTVAPVSTPPPTATPTKTPTSTAAPTTGPASNCDPAYPDVCIAPPPPDLDCGDIPYRRFRVLPPDPHRFDGNDNDGLGCES